MKSSGSPAVRGKRKLSTATNNAKGHFDSRSVAKRTRSSNNTNSPNQGNESLKRNTRSSSNEAFFELPYYSPKASKDATLVRARRRNKRSSTCSSTSSNHSVDSTSSPKADEHRPSRRSCRISSANDLCNEDYIVAKPKKLFEVIENGNPSPNSNMQFVETANVAENRVDITLDSSQPIKVELQNTENHDTGKSDDSLKCSIQSLDAKETITNGTAKTQSINKSLVDASRRRHLSDNCVHVPNMRRLRRLSEKGEMASVIELVFKQSKQGVINSLTPSNSCKTLQNHKPECTVTANETKEKNVNSLKTETTPQPTVHQRLWMSDSECENSTLEGKAFNAKTVTVPPVNKSEAHPKAAEENLKHTLLNGNGTVAQNVGNHCDMNKNPSTNHSPSYQTEPNTSQKSQTQEFKNWQQRNLRSSGVECKPDFYALSLNLMVHRKRKAKVSISDRNCMSDVETTDASKVPSKEQLLTDIPQVLSRYPQTTNSDPGQETPVTSLEKNVLHSPANPSSDNASEQNFPVISVSPSSGRSPAENTLTPPLLQIKTSPISTHSRGGRGRRGKGRGRGRGAGISRALPQIWVDPNKAPVLFEEEPPTGPEVYYFESDHVALKHNQDYHAVLRVAAILEAQRKQAMDDLDTLEQQLQHSLEEPISFVEKLQQKENLHLPESQQVPQLPVVDWSKYLSQFGTFDHVFTSSLTSSPSKPLTRKKKVNYGLGPANSKDNSGEGNSQGSEKSRSETFKKSWSVDEQRKLEELLSKFPQEAVEFNRYRKIAAELGGRTPLQVQSRVQKYFIKLAKAGLPIPGRMPRLDRLQSCKSRRLYKAKPHPQTALTRISTFFTDFHVPVKMQDDDLDDEHPLRRSDGSREEEEEGWDAISAEQISDEEDVPRDLRYSDEYLEILRLKRLRRQRLKMFDNNGHQPLAQHHGYQCDICKHEPIEGVRYHCIDCPSADSVDLCQNCIRHESMFETSVHKLSHRLEPVCASTFSSRMPGPSDGDSFTYLRSPRRPFADDDYTRMAARNPGEYNYLDPNYLPPTG